MKYSVNKIANYSGDKLENFEWVRIKIIGSNVSTLKYVLNYSIHQVKLEFYDI